MTGGSALGFHRACRFPAQIKAIVYMEAITQPLRWSDIGQAEPVFRALRTPAGEQMILDQNMFIEMILPGGVQRQLSDAEMAVYRAPFAARDDRWPTMNWPREIPFDGEPANVSAIVEDYAAWMAETRLPKLLIAGDPGTILPAGAALPCRNWRNQLEVSVPGLHFLQENSPHQIGEALKAFIRSLKGVTHDKLPA